MGATRSQPNLSGRVAPRHPPRLGDWQVRPDGTALVRPVAAQDTGGAIAGEVRADLFWGTGDAAGQLAGDMKQQGQIWMLWPKGAALPQVPQVADAPKKKS